MGVNLTLHSGTSAEKNSAVSTKDTPVYRLPGINLNRHTTITMDEYTASKHVLAIGGTGSGKTNLMFRFVDQTIKRLTDDDVVIIFDSKGDYYKRFHDKCDAVVLGNSAEYVAKSVRWNIFDEVTADGASRSSRRLNAMEIARSLFAERMKHTTNTFFPSAAQDVFSSLIIAILQDAEVDLNTRNNLFNKALIHYFQTSTAEDLCVQLAPYEELRAASSYIEGGSEQAQGVISEMYTILRDLFIGVFAEKGNFSMRNFVRKRGKKVLFLEYDITIGSVLTPVYRLLIDLALKEALSQHNTGGNVYFFFDEFKLVPYLQHVDDGVNFGRSKGVKIFAGLQSIEQLYDLYGQSRGRSIAAGFSTVFAFHANDEATMKYVSGLYGANLQVGEVVGRNNAVTAALHNGKVVEDWVMSKLDPGQAVVCLPSLPPFVMQFDEFS